MDLLYGSTVYVDLLYRSTVCIYRSIVCIDLLYVYIDLLYV